ncbi:hypothetical protein, partial [Amycolatopsis magusensis]
MKYVSIDIETTGTDRENCQVLEIGAVIEDSNTLLPLDELPTFRVLLHHEELYWEEVAKGMHQRNGLINDLQREPHLLDELEDRPQIINMESASEMFAQFLALHGFPVKEGRVEVVAAGKNFSTFDRVFLEKLPSWREHIKIFQRVLDPTLYYVDFKNDQKPP